MSPMMSHEEFRGRLTALAAVQELDPDGLMINCTPAASLSVSLEHTRALAAALAWTTRSCQYARVGDRCAC